MAIERDNVCWPSVERAIGARIEAIRAELETAPTEKVPHLQGQATAMRWLLQQGAPPPAPPDLSVPFE